MTVKAGAAGLLICRTLTSLVAMYVLKLSCSVCHNIGSGPTYFLTFISFVSTCSQCVLLLGLSAMPLNKHLFSTMLNAGGNFKHF